MRKLIAVPKTGITEKVYEKDVVPSQDWKHHLHNKKRRTMLHKR